MFVEINNTEMNAQKVDEWIKLTRRANGDVLSPEFALEILSKTNHIANIKTVLKNIKAQCVDESKKLVPEKVAPFREFILSCVDGREQSEMTMADLRELAGLCGCKEELEKLNKKEKVYSKTDCDNTIIVINKFEDLKEHLSENNLSVLVDADEFNVEAEYMGNISKLKFKKPTKVEMYCLACPKKMDFSNCPDVSLAWSDLWDVKEIKFMEGSEVFMQMVKNLPARLDFSNCSFVNLSSCDFKGVESIRFRKGCELKLIGARRLPEVLDLSKCSIVDLSEADLSGVKEIKFMKGANVKLSRARNLPAVLDLSLCDEVEGLCSSDILAVKTFKFKNKAQEEKFMEGVFFSIAEVKHTDGFVDFGGLADLR